MNMPSAPISLKVPIPRFHKCRSTGHTSFLSFFVPSYFLMGTPCNLWKCQSSLCGLYHCPRGSFIGHSVAYFRVNVQMTALCRRGEFYPI